MLVVESIDTGYGGVCVLRDVSLEVREESVVCLMGRNGVGKTTCVKAIMGVLPCMKGQIVWQGRNITPLPPHRRAAAGFGYVPQGRGIFPFLSVKENILTGLYARPRPPAEALDEMLEIFPALKGILARPGGALSGGQQQQLALARALIGRPKLLVLDEPTEGIQPSVIDEIEDLIHSLKAREGLSILLVEQRIDFARQVADWYFILDHGEVVSSGPPAELDEERLLGYLSV